MARGSRELSKVLDDASGGCFGGEIGKRVSGKRVSS
jgi:hypothetical protein